MTTQTASALTPSQRFRSLAAVIASSAVAGMTYGYMVPLLALMLERQGHSQSEIGINAASGPIATIVISLFVPAIIGRFGLLRSMLVAAVVEIFAIALMAYLPGLWSWFALRLLMGLSGGLLWISGETWILAVATPERRGRAIALYMMALSSGFAAGPPVIGWLGIEGSLPILFAAGTLVLSFLAILSASGAVPDLRSDKKGLAFSTIAKAPLVMAAAFLAGFIDTSALSHLPIYAERAGLETDVAVLILTVMLVANLCTQLPIGWLTERVSPRLLLVIFGWIFALVPIGFIFFMLQPFILWPLVVLMGAASLGIYTVALHDLGARFPASELAGANAMIVAVYQMGSIIGPPIGGQGMDRFGNDGLMYVFTAISSLFLVFAAVRSVMRRRASAKS